MPSYLNRTENFFALDSFSVKKIGVEKWHKKFYWPFTINFFPELNHVIIMSLLELINDSTSTEKDLLLINYSDFNSGLTIYIHHHLLFENIFKKNHSPLFEDSLRVKNVHKDLPLNSKLYWDEIINKKKLKQILSRPIKNQISFKDRVLFRLNVIQKNIKNNPKAFGNYFKNKRSRILIGERFSNEMLSFNKENLFRLPIEAINISKNPATENIKKIVDKFFEILHANTKNKFVNINFNSFKDVISSNLQLSHDYCKYFEKNLKKYSECKVFANHLSHPLIRSFCIGAKRNKIQTFGFPHGNYIGSQSALWVQLMFFGVVENFVCPNEGSLDLYIKSEKKLRTLINKKTTLVPNKNSNYFKNIYNFSIPKISNDDKKKKIMFVEVGLSDTAYYWPFYLDLTLKVAKALKNKEFELILKKRPERLEDSKHIYDNFFDTIITEPFEKVYKNADIFVFFEFGTTTFPVAALSKSPIIGFSHTLNQHWKEYQALINQRCEIIETNFDNKNSLIFCKKTLLSKLKKIKTPNLGLVKKFYLS